MELYCEYHIAIFNDYRECNGNGGRILFRVDDSVETLHYNEMTWALCDVHADELDIPICPCGCNVKYLEGGDQTIDESL